MCFTPRSAVEMLPLLMMLALQHAHAYPQWRMTIAGGAARSEFTKNVLNLAQCSQRQWTERRQWGNDDPFIPRLVSYTHQTMSLQTIGRFALLDSPKYKVQAQVVKCGSQETSGACFNGLAIQVKEGDDSMSLEWSCDYYNGKYSCKLKNNCQDETLLSKCKSCSGGFCVRVANTALRAEAVQNTYQEWYGQWGGNYHSRDQLDVYVRDAANKIIFRVSGVAASNERIDVQIGAPLDLKANGLCGVLQSWKGVWTGSHASGFGYAPDCTVVGDMCMNLDKSSMARNGECGCKTGKKMLTEFGGEDAIVAFNNYQADTSTAEDLAKWAESFRVQTFDPKESEAPRSLFRDDLQTYKFASSEGGIKLVMKRMVDEASEERARLVRVAHRHAIDLGQKLKCPVIIDDVMLGKMQMACTKAVQGCVDQLKIQEGSSKDKDGAVPEEKESKADLDTETRDDVSICVSGFKLGVDDIDEGCTQQAPAAIRSFLHKQFVVGMSCESASAAKMNRLEAASLNLEDTIQGAEVSKEATLIESLHNVDSITADNDTAAVLQPCVDGRGKTLPGWFWDQVQGELLFANRTAGAPEKPDRYGQFWSKGNDRHADYVPAPEGTVECFLQEDVKSKWSRYLIKTPASHCPGNVDVLFYRVKMEKDAYNQQMWEACQGIDEKIYPVCNIPRHSSYGGRDHNPPRCVNVGVPGSHFSDLPHSWSGVNFSPNPLKEAASYTGNANGNWALMGSGSSQRWTAAADYGKVDAACALPKFEWTYTVKSFEFKWPLLRATAYSGSNADFEKACKARGLPVVCGCDSSASYRNGKCLPLSMLTLKDRKVKCLWQQDEGKDWNTKAVGWFSGLRFYASGSNGKEAKARGWQSSSSYLWDTICADVRLPVTTGRLVGEIFRVPVLGPPTKANLLKACFNFEMPPLCDDGGSDDGHCLSFDNVKSWSADTSVVVNGVPRHMLFESFFYSTKSDWGSGPGESGPVVATAQNAGTLTNFATWCVGKRETNKAAGPALDTTAKTPPWVPKCQRKRDKWQKIFASRTPKICDARGVDLVVVVNEAAYLSRYAVTPKYDEQGQVKEASLYEGFATKDDCRDDPLESEFAARCDAVGGHQNLHRFVPRLMEEFANACEDGQVNRVAAVVNTGDAARPVQFACTDEEGDVDLFGTGCSQPLSYLFADAVVAFKHLNKACTEAVRNSTVQPQMGVIGLKKLSRQEPGGGESDLYERMPLCDAGWQDRPEDLRRPCWLCRQYDKKTGVTRSVDFDELTYRYPDNNLPICMNPKKCLNNPILTRNLTDWNCDANDFFLMGSESFECFGKPATGLQKAFNILEENQPVDTSSGHDRPSRKRVVVWISDGNFRDLKPKDEAANKIQQAYEEKVKEFGDPKDMFKYADVVKSTSQMELENEVLSEIQDFAAEDNTLFIALELQMDPRRKPNLDFFTRLKELKDTGKVNLHHVKPVKGEALLEAATQAEVEDDHANPKQRAKPQDHITQAIINADGTGTMKKKLVRAQVHRHDQKPAVQKEHESSPVRQEALPAQGNGTTPTGPTAQGNGTETTATPGPIPSPGGGASPGGGQGAVAKPVRHIIFKMEGEDAGRISIQKMLREVCYVDVKEDSVQLDNYDTGVQAPPANQSKS